MRIRLDLAYDGTAFNGWSRQPGLRTVQGVVEDALATIFQRHQPAPTLVVAGRTDAGVHARAQVAHLELSDTQFASLERPARGGHATALTEGSFALSHAATLPLDALARRLNGLMGVGRGGAGIDVLIRRASVAPDGFDARFSAVWRRYEYRIADSLAAQDPLERGRTTWLSSELDLEATNKAAVALLGLHDFASFCKPREGATTIRTLQDFVWHRDDAGVLVARVQADAFCHSMVRSLVGACVAAGEGRIPIDQLVLLRDVGTRTNAFKVMPAHGLTLVEVGYPDAAELAARAAETRARRALPS